MPNYGIAQAGSNTATPAVTTGGLAAQAGGLNVASLYPGETLVLFNAETPTAPQASIAFNRGDGPITTPAGITFTMHFAAAPTAAVAIQAANRDVDAEYQTVYTSTNKQDDFYADMGQFAFYRARLVSLSAGGALTVIAQR